MSGLRRTQCWRRGGAVERADVDETVKGVGVQEGGVAADGQRCFGETVQRDALVPLILNLAETHVWIEQQSGLRRNAAISPVHHLDIANVNASPHSAHSGALVLRLE